VISLDLGDIVYYEGQYGIIVDNVQIAWGAKRFKILFPDGRVKYVWDKHMEKVNKYNEN
tara:strand:- start:669 stop:845 length:177 start_codon:yes stop_codon:yes gene_type:complete